MFCACPPCLLLDFARCERTKQVGRVRPVMVPLPRGSTARVAQIDSLEEWGALLKPGWVVGVRVASDQLHIEGADWLLLIDSEAFEMPEDEVHSSDTIPAGWLVVMGRWYEQVQRSPRGYLSEGVAAAPCQHDDQAARHSLQWRRAREGPSGIEVWAPDSSRGHVQSAE